MQQRQKTPWGGYALILVLVIAIIFVFAQLYPQQFANLTRGLEPSCYMGLGTATVTVQSWSANKDCIAMLANADDFSGANLGKLGFHSVSEPSSGSIICEYDMSGRHVTVRDEAMSNAGSIACMALRGDFSRPAWP